MKLKGLITSTLIALLTTSALIGCSSGEKETNSTNNDVEVESKVAEGDNKTNSSGKSIRIINGKIEIDEALKAYAEKYQEQTGVEVIIESVGGGADIAATVKGYLAAGNMPDIFVFGGEGEYQTWKDYLEDLSNEPWASNTDVAYIGDEGKTVGFPYAVEGYGLTYNKDLLDKAGIDPATLTNIGAYQEAFEKIDGMKEELGIQAVLSMAAESGQMYWSVGNHNFGTYLATGIDRDDTTYIDKLKNGEIDDERMTQYAKFVKLLFDYSDKNVLVSGTYDDQLALWAQGKTVFIQQGNWIDPSLPDYDVTFNMGISPLAFEETDTDGILADAPSWWGVYNEGKNIQAAKDFLIALSSTEEGANCLVKEAGMISPFKDTKIEPDSPLAKSVMNWVQEGKTYAWQWTKLPDGFTQNTTAPIYESFAKGDIDESGFVELMKNAVATLK